LSLIVIWKTDGKIVGWNLSCGKNNI